MIDYYASDLVDMAVYLVNSWLMLQDARVSERNASWRDSTLASTCRRCACRAGDLRSRCHAPAEAD